MAEWGYYEAWPLFQPDAFTTVFEGVVVHDPTTDQVCISGYHPDDTPIRACLFDVPVYKGPDDYGLPSPVDNYDLSPDLFVFQPPDPLQNVVSPNRADHQALFPNETGVLPFKSATAPTLGQTHYIGYKTVHHSGSFTTEQPVVWDDTGFMYRHWDDYSINILDNGAWDQYLNIRIVYHQGNTWFNGTESGAPDGGYTLGNVKTSQDWGTQVHGSETVRYINVRDWASDGTYVWIIGDPGPLGSHPIGGEPYYDGGGTSRRLWKWDPDTDVLVGYTPFTVTPDCIACNGIEIVCGHAAGGLYNYIVWMDPADPETTVNYLNNGSNPQWSTFSSQNGPTKIVWDSDWQRWLAVMRNDEGLWQFRTRAFETESCRRWYVGYAGWGGGDCGEG